MIYFVFVNGNMKAMPKFKCLQHFYKSSMIQLQMYLFTEVFFIYVITYQMVSSTSVCIYVTDSIVLR